VISPLLFPGVLSLPLTLSAVLLQDLKAIQDKGFTQGYDHLTVILVLLQVKLEFTLKQQL